MNKFDCYAWHTDWIETSNGSENSERNFAEEKQPNDDEERNFEATNELINVERQAVNNIVPANVISSLSPNASFDIKLTNKT